MAIEISSTLLARLLTETRNSPEREICGLLFGTAQRIAAATACTNVAADPHRAFELDPGALFAALRAARIGGPTVIGHYHSHPSGVAVPSTRDAEGAMGDGALWLIVAAHEARLWRTSQPGAFVEIALIAIG
ncbi:Mov34/MPN/PAD-1 family protein [Sphingomonas sp. PAMC 26605]|uniref:Mov34/MPN/PAD-1 family protein n=1 Tax=Sphingomonas sp. PAMC 26605 TaxID=1112214 RepID=UPI00026CD123|nr:M67 family metallopeptidase [Sphingomonas sp. PAMC 26605]